MISLLLINSSNSLRLTNFFVPTNNTKGQFGVRNKASILLIPMLLYSAASRIVSVTFSWIGTFCKFSAMAFLLSQFLPSMIDGDNLKSQNCFGKKKESTLRI